MSTTMTKPKTRTFRVTYTVELEVSQELLDSVLTDEWRKDFYPFTQPEEVADMLAYNLMRGSRVEQLDGFADQKPGAAKLRGRWELDEVEEVEP